LLMTNNGLGYFLGDFHNLIWSPWVELAHWIGMSGILHLIYHTYAQVGI
jgi:hypothetical protein